jgi:hypothetical protein
MMEPRCETRTLILALKFQTPVDVNCEEARILPARMRVLVMC